MSTPMTKDHVDACRVLIVAMEKLRTQDKLNLGQVFEYSELAAISVSISRLAKLVNETAAHNDTMDE
jgi:hypothetical protein